MSNNNTLESLIQKHIKDVVGGRGGSPYLCPVYDILWVGFSDYPGNIWVLHPRLTKELVLRFDQKIVYFPLPDSAGSITRMILDGAEYEGDIELKRLPEWAEAAVLKKVQSH